MLRDLGRQQVGACRVLDLRRQCPASSTELILRAALRGMRRIPVQERRPRHSPRAADASAYRVLSWFTAPAQRSGHAGGSALAKWDEAEASEHNQNTARPPTITADSRTMSRAGEPRGKSSDAPYYRTPLDSFPVPARTWLHVSYAANSGESRRPLAVTTCGSPIVCPAGIRTGKRCSFTR